MSNRLFVGLAISLLAACSSAETPPPAEGFVAVPGGRIWYARMGDGPGTPLIVLHGGPGGTSFGLKPWAVLGDDRPVIRYDQLGAGKSDRPTDTTLFALDRSVRELQALRDSLGLREVHLYGRSWGAMIVEAYMATNPVGVRSITLSSPVVTTAQWERDADSLITTLPDSVQSAIERHEAAGTTSSPEYAAAAAEFEKRFIRRMPRRSQVDADSGKLTRNDTIYQYMWGPSEFTSTGTLRTFDATGWLKNVRVPALFLAGEFDEATPASTERFSRLVPGAEFEVIPNAGHSTENDNPEALLATVRDFLRRVDRGVR